MKRGILPDSPNKTLLKSKSDVLPKLPNRQREKVGQGDQSLILSDGHNQVLIVTRYIVAKKIELLRSKVTDDTRSKELTIPVLAAVDSDLASMVNPDNPDKARLAFKYETTSLPTELWTKNIIYQMPRFDGTLEKCQTDLKYKEENIEALENYLYRVVELLHDYNLSHNDICLKNIFYSGTYPNLQFHLGDFGSLTENDPKSHIKKCENDYQKILRVIEQLKRILQRKRQKVDERAPRLPGFLAAQYAAKLGVSPLKPEKNSQLMTKEDEDNTEVVTKKNSNRAKRLIFGK